MKGEERFDSTTKSELTGALAKKGSQRKTRLDAMTKQKMLLVQRVRRKQTPQEEKATCNDQA